MHTTILTPQMSKVRDIADEAMNTVEGVIVTFTAERYGDLVRSHAAARGLQVAFSALRSRERRIAARRGGVPDYERDSFVKGPYDGLACELRPMAHGKGHEIIFTPNGAYGMEFEVTDRRTGLPLERINPTEARLDFLFTKALEETHAAEKQHRARMPLFNEEEREFMWKHRPQFCEELRIGKPQSMIDADQPDRPESDYASVDLADLSEDELEIVNPVAGE